MVHMSEKVKLDGYMETCLYRTHRCPPQGDDEGTMHTAGTEKCPMD